jgi:mono/diheme cytochrome c family protein
MKLGVGSLNLKSKISNLKSALSLCALVVTLFLLSCDTELRKSDAELGLNPQQAAGRRIYDQSCDRCHAPYSSRGRKGPSMKGVFRKPFLSESGLPANNDRVAEIVRYGRNNMPAFGPVLNQQQMEDLLAYLHTL